MIRQTVLLLACMTLLAGCVDFRYDGGTEASGPDEVTVFNRADGVRRPYRVFGRATVSGDYRDVSRDRLITRLQDEARDRGADAVLITEQQVVPKSETRNIAPRFTPAANGDGENSRLSQISRDVDMTYGRYGDSPEVVTPDIRYARILKADFLKYNDGTAPKPPEITEPAAAAEKKKKQN